MPTPLRLFSPTCQPTLSNVIDSNVGKHWFGKLGKATFFRRPLHIKLGFGEMSYIDANKEVVRMATKRSSAVATVVQIQSTLPCAATLNIHQLDLAYSCAPTEHN